MASKRFHDGALLRTGRRASPFAGYRALLLVARRSSPENRAEPLASRVPDKGHCV